MDITALYRAASHAGLLTPVTVGSQTVECAFRAPDEDVLDGLVLSRDYQIRYPAAWLSLAVGDELMIHGQAFLVRQVRAVGDGSEALAYLSRQ